MEITNICPYCGKEMQDGAIESVRDMTRWCRRNEDGGYDDGWKEGVLLGKAHVFSAGYAPALYCEGCRVVIVPVRELETFADKAGRWLDKTLGSLGERMDRAAERREEERAEQKKEEKRKKDPWEV